MGKFFKGEQAKLKPRSVEQESFFSPATLAELSRSIVDEIKEKPQCEKESFPADFKPLGYPKELASLRDDSERLEEAALEAGEILLNATYDCCVGPNMRNMGLMYLNKDYFRLLETVEFTATYGGEVKASKPHSAAGVRIVADWLIFHFTGDYKSADI